MTEILLTEVSSRYNFYLGLDGKKMVVRGRNLVMGMTHVWPLDCFFESVGAEYVEEWSDIIAEGLTRIFDLEW